MICSIIVPSKSHAALALFMFSAKLLTRCARGGRMAEIIFPHHL
jgi:hypothetical protein